MYCIVSTTECGHRKFTYVRSIGDRLFHFTHTKDTPLMSSRVGDDTISVVMSTQPASQGRLKQLEGARKMAVVSRRHKQKQRLEAKLNELRLLMGEDMSNSMLERTAARLMAQEESLRAKQNAITEACNENLDSISQEIKYLRRLFEQHFSGSTYRPSTYSTTQSTHSSSHSSKQRSPRGSSSYR